MRAIEIEEAIFELEDLRVVIRCPQNEDLGDYNYQRAAAGNISIREWLDNRVRPILNGHSVTVINCRGEIPNARTLLENLRNTYTQRQ